MAEHPSIEQLERRVKADPMSIAFATLAEEYRRVGRFQEAIDICRAGLDRHPAYLSARVTLGRALVEIGALAEAEVELERVLAAAPENLAAIRGLAEIHHRRGEIPEAAEQYRSALQVSEQTAEAAAPASAADDSADDGLSLTHLQEALQKVALEGIPDVSPRQPDPALPGLERLLNAIVKLRETRGSEGQQP
jgi:tetratricopeptide (TPR) repeat protein